MSVSVSDIFNAGQALAQGGTEADWRNSASRVYYAAYHRAMASVDLCPDNSNQKMGDHERVSDRFTLHKTKAATSIAYVLIGMKRIRRMADYEISDGFEMSLAVNQIAQFQALSAKLLSFDDAHLPKQAEAG